MKAILLLTTLAMTISSFTAPTEEIRSSEKLSERIVAALRSESTEAYLALLPSQSDFDHLMEANASFYGANLRAAKEDFNAYYADNLIPQARLAFQRVLHEGRLQGIQWSSAEVISFTSAADGGLVITLASGGKRCRLRLGKVLVLNESWKTTQYIELQ